MPRSTAFPALKQAWVDEGKKAGILAASGTSRSRVCPNTASRLYRAAVVACDGPSRSWEQPGIDTATRHAAEVLDPLRGQSAMAGTADRSRALAPLAMPSALAIQSRSSAQPDLTSLNRLEKTH